MAEKLSRTKRNSELYKKLANDSDLNTTNDQVHDYEIRYENLKKMNEGSDKNLEPVKQTIFSTSESDLIKSSVNVSSFIDKHDDEYLDSFISEVKDYNKELGLLDETDTQLNILSTLSKDKKLNNLNTSNEVDNLDDNVSKVDLVTDVSDLDELLDSEVHKPEIEETKKQINLKQVDINADLSNNDKVTLNKIDDLDINLFNDFHTNLNKPNDKLDQEADSKLIVETTNLNNNFDDPDELIIEDDITEDSKVEAKDTSSLNIELLKSLVNKPYEKKQESDTDFDSTIIKEDEVQTLSKNKIDDDIEDEDDEVDDEFDNEVNIIPKKVNKQFKSKNYNQSDLASVKDTDPNKVDQYFDKVIDEEDDKEIINNHDGIMNFIIIVLIIIFINLIGVFGYLYLLNRGIIG